MDDEAETYKLWRIRKTVMQVILLKIISCRQHVLEYLRFVALS